MKHSIMRPRYRPIVKFAIAIPVIVAAGISLAEAFSVIFGSADEHVLRIEQIERDIRNTAIEYYEQCHRTLYYSEGGFVRARTWCHR